MPREINFEIIFSGLCIVDMKSRSDDWLTVYMVNATHQEECEATKGKAGSKQDHIDDPSHNGHGVDQEHRPLLNYYAQDDLALPADYELRPSPLGKDVASIRLDHCDVTIEVDQRAAAANQFTRAEPADYEQQLDDDRPPPDSKVSGLAYVLTTDDLKMSSVTLERDICQVRVPNGRWECTGVVRNRMTSEMVARSYFLDESLEKKKPLAHEVRLVLEGLSRGPKIQVKNRCNGQVRTIVLTPDVEGRVFLS